MIKYLNYKVKFEQSSFRVSLGIYCWSIPETDFDLKVAIYNHCTDTNNFDTNCRVPGYLSVFFLLNFSFNLFCFSFILVIFLMIDVGSIVLVYTDKFKMIRYHVLVYSAKQTNRKMSWSSQASMKQTGTIKTDDANWTFIMIDEQWKKKEALVRNIG